MPPTRQLSLPAPPLAILAAVSLALAGCGQSAVQQFRGSLNPIKQRVQTERSQIAGTLQAVGVNDRRGARLLGQEIAALARTVAQMGKISAPSAAAQSAFASYHAANSRLVASLYRVAGLVAHGTVHQLRIASLAATGAAGAVQRASDALEAALGP
jgi:hypothetical protein